MMEEASLGGAPPGLEHMKRAPPGLGREHSREIPDVASPLSSAWVPQNLNPVGQWAPEAFPTPSPMFGGSMPSMMAMPSLMTMPDEIQQALHMCKIIDDINQAMQNRISKLERSRGQINKDVQDMLKDVQEWRKQDTLKADTKAEALPAFVSAYSPIVETSPVSSENSSSQPPLGLQLAPIKDTNEYRLTWRLEKSKFRECVNRPLVSQHITIQGKELKLMISLGNESEIDGQSARDVKATMEKLVRDGPLTGSVKLKAVADNGGKLLMKFKLFVGSIVQDIVEHDFGDRVTFESKFESDWLKEFIDGTLVIGCDILSITESP